MESELQVKMNDWWNNNNYNKNTKTMKVANEEEVAEQRV